MNKLCFSFAFILAFYPSFLIAKTADPEKTYPKAPFGFNWGMSIDLVKKMDWVKSKNNNEFVCAKKTGSLITKCTNSYAPSQLMLDGDYSLFFDQNNRLFKVSFSTSGIFDSKGKKDSLYFSYKKYKTVLQKKYGKPDFEDFSDGYYYQWGVSAPKISLSTRNDKSMVYLDISYFSPESKRIIKSDLDYYSNYEFSIM